MPPFRKIQHFREFDRINMVYNNLLHDLGALVAQ